jgi:D-aminopeptidase
MPTSAREGIAPGGVTGERLDVPLFQAVAEATEEAIYNSLFRATAIKGFKRTVAALPLERRLELLKIAGAISRGDEFRSKGD